LYALLTIENIWGKMMKALIMFVVINILILSIWGRVSATTIAPDDLFVPQEEQV